MIVGLAIMTQYLHVTDRRRDSNMTTAHVVLA